MGAGTQLPEPLALLPRELEVEVGLEPKHLQPSWSCGHQVGSLEDAQCAWAAESVSAVCWTGLQDTGIAAETLFLSVQKAEYGNSWAQRSGANVSDEPLVTGSYCSQPAAIAQGGGQASLPVLSCPLTMWLTLELGHGWIMHSG